MIDALAGWPFGDLETASEQDAFYARPLEDGVCLVWFRFRDGREMHRPLPCLMADWLVASIPLAFPEVERTKITRR